MSAESTYSYRARDASGTVVSGSMVASSAKEVSTKLRADGKFVIAVDDRPHRMASAPDADSIRKRQAAKRVRRDDVIAFCQQLSVMLDTGVPLAEALDAFRKQTPKPEFQHVLAAVSHDVSGGETLSVAMERWPSVFPRIVVSLMKASEASGTMALMLGRVGDYLSKERRTTRQIKGALSYPIFMLLIGLGLSVFLMLVILPRFAKIYEGKGASLPTPTKILLAASEFLRDDYLMWGPPLIVAVVGGLIFAHTSRGRSILDWLRLHVPVLRTMYRQLYITRAARTMSTLLAAGVNLLDIIDICRTLTGNRHFNRVWNQMESGVRDGRQLSESIVDSEYIPANVASMIASGERSGRLAEVMERIADFADEELENAIKQVTSYIEPIMILIMGVVVGGVAMALLLPIFKIGNVVAGGG